MDPVEAPLSDVTTAATVEPAKENLRELRTKAMAQFADVNADAQRLKRLDSLLEKSAAYVSFVSQKLQSKRAQLRAATITTESNNSDGSNNRKRAPAEETAEPVRKKRGRPARKSIPDGEAPQQPTADPSNPEERAINGEKVSPRQPHLITGGVMREYQLEGMEWLASLYENGLNGILADEMGLGKTLQTIAFLSFLRERRVWGPFLVLCPLSTLSNWVSEFYRFAPTTPVLSYHGTPDERRDLRKRHLGRLDPGFPVVVTTYEIAMKDKQALQRFAWKFIIIDEGHRIKNLNCKLVRDLKSYQSANRLLLTGTPLQNSLSELWSLLNFLLPDIFDDLDSFQAWFDFDDLNGQEGRDRIISQQTSSKVVSKLHQILQPFLLRRLKSDVENLLPPKREYLIACPMAPMQYEYYQAVRGPTLRAFLEDRFSALATTDDSGASTLVPSSPMPSPIEAPRRRRRRLASGAYVEPAEDDPFSDAESENGDSKPAENIEPQPDAEPTDQSTTNDPLGRLRASVMVRQMNLQFRLMQQRKVCQHPYLFDFPVQDPLDPESEYLIDEQLVRSSGKLLVLDRLLPELFKEGHRVLIFSQFARMLDVLEFYAELRNYRFCRIDGSVAQTDRQDAIVRFNTDKDIPLFLLTTRSGGLGINLTAADTVIIFDSDWNPQQDLQAQDRVHRIGQKSPVIIYRLIIAGSCEKAMLQRAKGKRRLEKLVIHEKKFKGHQLRDSTEKTDLSIGDIAQILMDDDDELVDKDQRELKKILENLGPDDQIPADAVLSEEELRTLTDRAPEAYLKKKIVDSGRFKQMETAVDDQNDLLATIKA
ncbi:putative ATPase [Coemansia sp. RSA 1722]|nr:putative ATPase [Coemansia sp. RSA 486]KAJ2227544.1 putative ATPase [Coemansia sp. RSA 485]KAJ2592106.1 putative ATPase [Coemansia sp. RSA 1722]